MPQQTYKYPLFLTRLNHVIFYRNLTALQKNSNNNPATAHAPSTDNITHTHTLMSTFCVVSPTCMRPRLNQHDVSHYRPNPRKRVLMSLKCRREI